VIVATDGKYGTRVTKIPEGDELGRVRRKETECACEKLGIEKPIYLGLERLDTKIGVRPYLTAHKSLLNLLKEKFEDIKPDVLITFGPDGEYGHSEHLVVGAAVQELLLREGWVRKYPLYFPLETKTSSADDPDLGYVNESYINASVVFSDADEERGNEAGKCYVSQFTPEEVQKNIEAVRKDKTNIRHFRRFVIDERRSKRDLIR
jgi:LmbE family N-acetylglucosaminyl deacetylase